MNVQELIDKVRCLTGTEGCDRDFSDEKIISFLNDEYMFWQAFYEMRLSEEGKNCLLNTPAITDVVSSSGTVNFSTSGDILEIEVFVNGCWVTLESTSIEKMALDSKALCKSNCGFCASSTKSECSSCSFTTISDGSEDTDSVDCGDSISSLKYEVGIPTTYLCAGNEICVFPFPDELTQIRIHTTTCDELLELQDVPNLPKYMHCILAFKAVLNYGMLTGANNYSTVKESYGNLANLAEAKVASESKAEKDSKKIQQIKICCNTEQYC